MAANIQYAVIVISGSKPSELKANIVKEFDSEYAYSEAMLSLDGSAVNNSINEKELSHVDYSKEHAYTISVDLDTNTACVEPVVKGQSHGLPYSLLSLVILKAFIERHIKKYEIVKDITADDDDDESID